MIKKHVLGLVIVLQSQSLSGIIINLHLQSFHLTIQICTDQLTKVIMVGTVLFVTLVLTIHY